MITRLLNLPDDESFFLFDYRIVLYLSSSWCIVYIGYIIYIAWGFVMSKILLSIPDDIASRMRAAIPHRQRSKVMVRLLEAEIEKREKALYECALAVEQDELLNDEMNAWDLTCQDGLNHESW
tara:strand:+ start:2240 stop:2608 length:369 start_codon:yes stop_codon:yes gene_type:complete